MKLGLSSYSLLDALEKKEMSILDVVEWIAQHGGEHMEIVPYGYTLLGDDELIEALKAKAQEVGIELSNYSLPANFIQPSPEELDAEIARVKSHVDVANRLGIKYMRHDVNTFSLPVEQTTISYFELHLPQMAEACRQIADYAANFGITTSVENHGHLVQNADRVQRLIAEVDRSNFKTTLDIGNFMCVDEPSLVGVMKNLPYASLVHLKDFYFRPYDADPGEGYFKTVHNNFLRGAIIGQGEIPMKEVVKLVKDSGYDGYITIEFEGIEDCRLGSRIGLVNARKIWNEV
ncbi:sugar phosphate isomerase/epimerase [Paenibacillus sp. 19GGS1-52]|uniref:sugar phosphate isomerase/epimerase family protein n=1 Tax=Paenibacillus sp. 19GGS1-52 TaxID=2758563 RepID=UPI001EFC2BAC|nr:sugar phosphate isomerase/epimerase [Paenibacillus sp. 19GGS1-52]ULO07716.1 sugar phosphate isomerase/epimerase [Paenibacillus sp. 19GGS1-52]